MRLVMGLMAMAALTATSALAAESSSIGFVTVLECDGNGVKELAIRSAGALYRAHLDLTNGDGDTFSVRRVPAPRNRAGGATVYKGTNFELSITLTTAADSEGRRKGSLVAKVGSKKLDQTVSCKRN